MTFIVSFWISTMRMQLQKSVAGQMSFHIFHAQFQEELPSRVGNGSSLPSYSNSSSSSFSISVRFMCMHFHLFIYVACASRWATSSLLLLLPVQPWSGCSCSCSWSWSWWCSLPLGKRRILQWLTNLFRCRLPIAVGGFFLLPRLFAMCQPCHAY